MAKILVIEDAEYLARGIARVLELEGHTVAVALSGRQGIQQALAEKPDLILCDLTLPEIDGIQVLQLLRHTAECATVPFILLTARSSQLDARLGIQAGADDFINKPVDSETLLRLVNYYLEQRQSLQEEYRQRTSELEQSLTYALPHEFRTALNEILGVATHLKVFADRFSPEELRELGADLARSARRLLRLSENILLYARVDFLANAPELLQQLRQFTTEEPAAIVQDIAIVKAEEAQRGADVRLTIEATGIQLAMPSEHFAKIVEELLDNALKFSPPATPVLVRTWAAGDAFWVEIRDHGPGIPPELQKRIRAYYQPGRLLYEQQGIGLGLTLAKRLVELYEGQFELVTPADGGTLVRFGLPMKR